MLLTWVVLPFAGTTADLRQESVDDDDDDVVEDEEVEIVSEFWGKDVKTGLFSPPLSSPLLPPTPVLQAAHPEEGNCLTSTKLQATRDTWAPSLGQTLTKEEVKTFFFPASYM